jgi:hypothetical protein
MTLKEFIRESLTQIIDGAIAAHEEVKEKGGAVNPVQIRKKRSDDADGSIGYINNVKFDVALTDAKKQSSTAGIGVFLGNLAAGGKVEKGTEASALTRIKFEIPIGLPYGRSETPPGTKTPHNKKRRK